MVHRYLVNTYCIVAALFFAACACAQLNDPDPIIWIFGYLFGGCVLNGMVMLMTVKHHVGDCGGEERDAHDDTHRPKYRAEYITLLHVFLLLNVVAILSITASLMHRIDWSLPPRRLVWSVLEYEEGREIAGLILLLLHVSNLRGYVSPRGETNKEREIMDVNDGKSKSIGCGSSVGTGVMGAMIIFSVYLWIYYQPEMNARYETQHCDGAFSIGGITSSNEL